MANAQRKCNRNVAKASAYLCGQADANIGHGFAIFMANVGALRTYLGS